MQSVKYLTVSGYGACIVKNRLGVPGLMGIFALKLPVAVLLLQPKGVGKLIVPGPWNVTGMLFQSCP
jgi:hypothetical protein